VSTETQGLGIYQITMPIPFPLAQVHAYLIETGDGWAMVDAGFPSEEALAVMQREIDRIAGGPEQIRTVFISHYHPDHSGLAGWLEEAGAQIVIHERDFPQVQRMNSDEPVRPEEYGGAAFAAMAAATSFSWEEMRKEMHRLRFPVREPRLVQGGETVTVGGREFKLVWTPGHTEGHLCVLDVTSNLLFCGDHMLARITPHIGMWRDNGSNPLHRYEESLALVEQMAPARGLPAHEAPIEDLAWRARDLRRHHQQRRERLLDAMGPDLRKPLDIATAVFTGREGPMQMFLALSETLSHLEALVLESLVAREETPDGVLYRLA